MSAEARVRMILVTYADARMPRGVRQLEYSANLAPDVEKRLQAVGDRLVREGKLQMFYIGLPALHPPQAVPRLLLEAGAIDADDAAGLLNALRT